MERTMIRFAIKSVLVLVLLAFAAIAIFAATVTCPVHSSAMCTYTGQDRWDDMGHQWQQYSCSCGDTVWVKR